MYTYSAVGALGTLSIAGCSSCYYMFPLPHVQAPMLFGEDTPSLKFVEISAERIARQLTVIEHEVLQRIKPLWSIAQSCMHQGIASNTDCESGEAPFNHLDSTVDMQLWR